MYQRLHDGKFYFEVAFDTLAKALVAFPDAATAVRGGGTILRDVLDIGFTRHRTLNEGQNDVELLLDRGADINHNADDSRHPYNPLMTSIQASSVNRQLLPIVELLLDRGANPNITAPYDRSTPAMFAVEWINPKAVELLIQRGADLTALDAWEFTVMDHYTKMSQRRLSQNSRNLLRQVHTILTASGAKSNGDAYERYLHKQQKFSRQMQDVFR